MDNESTYARNFERRELAPYERFAQVVTIYDLPMSNDRRIGQEIAPGEYLQMFKVAGRSGDVVVQIRVDRSSYWLLSRQTFSLGDDATLVAGNPESGTAAFELFQLRFQDEIDTTRHQLRTSF